jgi:hypothetical protein
VDGYLSSEDSWRGRFWLPEHPDDIQRGILTYTPDKGLRLVLIGGFTDNVWLPTENPHTRVLSSGTRRWPLIHGAVGNQRATLIDCVAVSSSSYFMGREVAEQEIRAQVCLLGVLLTDPGAQVFSEVSVEIENLTGWDSRPDMVWKIEQPEAGRRPTRWEISVEPAEPRTVTIGDLTVELHRWYRLPSYDSRRGRLEAATFAVSHFTLSSTEPKSVDVWMETAGVLQDLITLAMDTPCAVLKAEVKPTDELKNDPNSAVRNQVVVYARHVVNGDPDASGAEGWDAPFILGVEGVAYEDVVTRWFKTHDRFRVACDMILGLIYRSEGYIQTQLITAVAAAEAFHQALRMKPPMPNSEFNKLKKALLAVVPDSRKRWLSEKLGRNAHTLKNRLTDLAARPDSRVMAELLPNPEGWASAAKDARNVVAHGGKGNNDIVLMHAITEVTLAVVIVNLFHELRIPSERLMQSLTSTGRLTRAARLAREHWPAVEN